jgi:hypothetical protein
VIEKKQTDMLWVDIVLYRLAGIDLLPVKQFKGNATKY